MKRRRREERREGINERLRLDRPPVKTGMKPVERAVPRTHRARNRGIA